VQANQEAAQVEGSRPGRGGAHRVGKPGEVIVVRLEAQLFCTVFGEEGVKIDVHGRLR
jgi:hypothetical protein